MQKDEQGVIEKCKLEAKNRAMRQKEQRKIAIQTLLGHSLIDKKEKQKTFEIAKKLAGNKVDLTELFADEKKKKD